MRNVYLDNIRWGTVLLVFLYHICYLFNGVGVPGGIPGAESVPALDVFAAAVYPWFMVLLFAVAGMSAQYALERRTPGDFLRERRDKLLVPSTLGLFVLHWTTGYLNIRLGGGLAFIPAALVYPIAAVSGTGPLWFAQMLFLFSCLLLPIRRLDRDKALEKLPVWAVFLLFLPLWGSSQVLNVPVLTMYRFGIYLAAFLMGYFILSHEKIQRELERFRLPLLGIATASGAVCTVRWLGKNYTDPACLQSLPANLCAWSAVLAVLGLGRRHLNRESAFTRYMRRTSFGIYVLHYPVLLAICSGLHAWRRFPAVWNYALALVIGLPATLGLYEAIRRIPVVRYLLLGQRGR